ncbi:protein-export chaperone SecB [Leadbetterella sp. DM7]|uniref:protein-export chaperone SecB n=1 Tax=Leadbetterella sp. DM7 TaxID=3235085 RepID=UPI00349E723D
MSTETQVKLRFLSVDFPVVNFHSEKKIVDNQDINIKIEPKVFFSKGSKDHFKIIQEVNVSAHEAFNLFIVAIGNFELNDVIDEKMRDNFINMNAPAIMFPYIRAFISTLTSNLGNVTGTLNIPPQFFKGNLEQISEEDLEIK